MSEFLRYFDSLSKKPNNYKNLIKESEENMSRLNKEVRNIYIVYISFIYR